jgi:hypothetical protein
MEPKMPPLEAIRKRILLFYFVGGANIVMGLLVLAAGAGFTGVMASLAFMVFAFLQFYMARNMQRRYEAAMRAGRPHDEIKRDEVKRDEMGREGP